MEIDSDKVLRDLNAVVPQMQGLLSNLTGIISEIESKSDKDPKVQEEIEKLKKDLGNIDVSKLSSKLDSAMAGFANLVRND